MQERTIEFDIGLLITLEIIDGNALVGIEHLRVFESAVHALYYRTSTKSSLPHRDSPTTERTH